MNQLRINKFVCIYFAKNLVTFYQILNNFQGMAPTPERVLPLVHDSQAATDQKCPVQLKSL